MSLRKLNKLWAIILLATLTLPAWADAKTEATLAEGRKASQQFFKRDTAALWARMTPEMQAAVKTAEGLAKFRADLDQQFGEEQALVNEDVTEQNGVQLYLRTGRWSKASTPIQLLWAFMPDKRIAGFYVRPAQTALPESPYKDYQTKTTLRLPVEGEWLVFWGGRSQAQNYHIVARDQRFAYDLLKVVDGKSYKGDGKKLSDYYAWDQKILAPAAGTVVEVVDGLPDQAIGSSDPQHAAGNHVVLDLGQGEYTVLAHLRQGSVRVKVGDKVALGDELGRCGNSGNTSEPHLHFHLQDKPRFGEGDGLPAYLSGYVQDGKPVARGELLKGKRVSPGK